ncbi:MAG: NAD(P)-dependent oxidoreductase [Paramuribaculum sp.]|nr:NAD(P)-dependent oxidoreductase [Paramuribaculum sp.]
MNSIIAKDLKQFTATFDLAGDIENTTFIVTGATGLIGSTIIRCLIALNRSIRIYAPVRDIEKAKEMFPDNPDIILMEGDLLDFDYTLCKDVDYIIHCAAPTASKFFVDHSVETIRTIVFATNRILDFARQNPVKSIVYLSSMEVYGQIVDENPITENVQGHVNPLQLRSSYPMAKRLAENLCCAYASEYALPVKIARLAQTVGAGVGKTDNRAITQFIKLALAGKDIILHTTGQSTNPICYTVDAVSAILYILMRGENGNAYNVANEANYTSVFDLAQLIKRTINPDIDVTIELNDRMGFPPTTHLRLSCDSLHALGWKAHYSLEDVVTRLAAYLSHPLE